jgi:threonine dehydrogenase-like Zn-dependent dehydrogenase
MKAITVIPGSKGSVQLAEIERPQPKPNEVLLRVAKLGIDGTDRDINDGFYGAPPDGENFLVVGHEVLGTIEETGQSVQGFSKGDLVVPTVRRSCPENCLNCSRGESDMCLTGHYFEHGICKLHGFASEVAVSDSNFLVKIPSELADVAVLLEPTSIVEKATYQISQIQKRMTWEPKTALVLGAGPIGQLGTFLLRLRGLEVFTMARRPKDDLKARLVEAVGAKYVDATQTSLNVLGKDFDVIIEGTGNASVALEAMNHLSTNGALCLLGVYSASQLTFQFGDLLREMVLRNKLVFGSVNANKRYFEMGLTDFRQIKKRFGDVLSRMFTLVLKPEEFKQAFEPQLEDIKTIIDFE